MAGVHFSWRKRAFRAHWVLSGAPGFIGSIAATGDAPAATYVWSVSSGSSDVTGDLIASGAAATLSDARLLASRAVFAALRTPAGRTEPSAALVRQTAS